MNQSNTTAPLATLVTNPFFNSLSWGAKSSSTDATGLAGLQAGYNVQVGNSALIGLEADANALTAPNAVNNDFTTGAGGALVNNQVNRSIPWLSTACGCAWAPWRCRRRCSSM